jgi:hypothetical protein
MRKPIMSARLWTTWSGQRGSSMQRARRLGHPQMAFEAERKEEMPTVKR